ncbi:response regulator [Flavobacterium sp.]|uniref:response regulator n=1 Tax=Flavobacterium sp. TaxID=239 RepID=UPI0011FB951B|nr:response regulator [Flavobacterium sp.]RZJ73064.1 MAG: response regulator [Flavobacterium sp.]
MKKEKIVFHVDDDQDDRLFFEEALESFGSKDFHSFGTFEAALKALAHTQPDLIYMDFWIPGTTAPQFLKSLSEKIDMSKVTVHIISGTEVPYFFRELLDRYDVQYHLKPNSLKDLKNLLATELRPDAELKN